MIDPFLITPKNQSSLGFTLLELIVSITIVTLIVLVALPSYQSAILQIRRAEARAALHNVMLQQERFYTIHHRYITFTADTKNAPFKWWSGSSIETSYYEISATPCPGKQLDQCVQLTASSNTPRVKPVDDPICGNLMLDSAHHRSYSMGREPNPLCW